MKIFLLADDPVSQIVEGIMHTPHKSAYTKPELVEVGSFQDVTLGNATGATLDADFPAGTPFGDLGFS